MPVRRLPQQPNLEHLRKQAKALRRRVRAGEPGSVALVGEYHPNPPVVFGLSDAQLVTARMYGFGSWPKLVQHIETVHRYSRSPHEVQHGDGLAGEFLRLACLTYGDDYRERIRGADKLLTSAATVDVFTMAATGSADALRSLLAGDPLLARTQGGPFGWEPLLYLCYSRVDTPGRYLDAARLLLESGADPNAGFLWEGLPSPFTALTGALGGGEGDQPPHRDGMALARLLLEAGADPNDSQALYNLGLGGSWSDDTAHLELLLAFGLGQGDGGPWRARLGHTIASPRQLIRDELATAALRGGPRRTALLLEHGAEVDGIGEHPLFGGRTPYELALLNGHTEVANLLAAKDGSADLTESDAFIAACLRADTSVLSADPQLIAKVRTETPGLIDRATEHGNLAAVRLLAELGFDVNHRRGTTPLHTAVWNNDEPMVRTLIALGADPTIEDADHNSTPLGWAEYLENDPMATYLREVTPSTTD
ncbi:ankyrin repeat domain-containing protein [Nocardia sp. NPDC052566]|uniref:ankyrin repeat domain-containing protein n=1 Tax=Nocardia sp. NPDC052566 TaxID=3364330 RepID=UPI0037C5A97E